MQEQEPKKPTNETTKVRLNREHATGIIIPWWWRGNIAIILSIVAAISVGFSILMLDEASERIEEQQNAEITSAAQPSTVENPTGWYQSQETAPDLPLDALAKRFPAPEELPQNQIERRSQEEPARAYEETLPTEAYEDAPVIKDASGPRIAIPEEYIPDPETYRTPGVGTVENYTTTQDYDDPAEVLVPSDRTKGAETVSGTGHDIEIKSFELDLLEQQQAWLTNAIPFTSENTSLSSNAPMIAIVIDDMGVDLRRTPRATALPGPLTMSFLTYARELETQTQAALDAGHELMIHIPMEPNSRTIDPGPNVLRVKDTVDQTLKRLRWGLDQFDGYVGLNNHMGSKFTQDTVGMRAVLEEVRERGLLFLDSRTAGGSVAAKIANEMGVPFATRNVFLDHVDDESEIRKRLKQTEQLARKNGAAVAIGHPHDATLKILEEWLPGVAEKGFRLVPMSELVRRTWLKDH